MPADHYMAMPEFELAGTFEAFPGSTSGVDVTTAANPLSADLVVSGVDDGAPTVQRFDLFRRTGKDTTLSVRPLSRTTAHHPISAVGGK